MMIRTTRATLAALAMLLVPHAAAFSKPSVVHRALVGASRNGPTTTGGGSTRLFQEAPKYQKLDGILRQSERVGKGSYLLTIDYNNNNNQNNADENNNKDAEFPDYQAGHVLALEIQPPSTAETTSSKGIDYDDDIPSGMTTMTEKTQKDLANNGGWLRGPYTVSFGYGGDNDDETATNGKSDGFKILVKEVGYKSHVLATSKPGTPVLFGGKFKVPIAEGIVAASDASQDGDDESYGETKRAVLISSGVGIGPCVGAIEDLLGSSSSSTTTEASGIDSIDLIASFRTKEEIAMDAALDELLQTTTAADATKPTVHWKPVVTSEDGRISSKGPEPLRESYLRSSTNACSAVTNTHYHIIGNGQMVTEWKEGLSKAGVPKARVTVEAYFNHSAKPDPSSIDAICEAVRGLDTADDTPSAATKETAEETQEA